MQLAEVLQNLLEEAEVQIIKIFGESSGGEQNGGNGGGRGQQCEIFSDQWVQKSTFRNWRVQLKLLYPLQR